jgi:hypothetical protein
VNSSYPLLATTLLPLMENLDGMNNYSNWNLMEMFLIHEDCWAMLKG